MRKKSIVIIAIVALACVAAIIAVIWKNAPAQKQKKQLELGNRYLEEMKYEQAKVVFEELITIDPSNVGAYLGAAKAYVGLEDYEGAVILLQEGYKQTGSEDIKVQMEQYEKKLEEKKEKAKQELETEIKEYLSNTIPFESTLPYRVNPLYTYTYLKTTYAERLPQLYQYMENNLSDVVKCAIYRELHSYYLYTNDMENAKKCWSQYLALQGQTGDELYDEYGRILEKYDTDLEGDYHAYGIYYDNSGLLENYRIEYPDHVDVYTLEYDTEGRATKITWKYSDTKSYEYSNIYLYTYISPIEAEVVVVSVKDGSVLQKIMLKYDRSGHRILEEAYDAKGNLEDRIEHEYDEIGGQVINWYDRVGNLTKSEEYDAEGNVISSTTY